MSAVLNPSVSRTRTYTVAEYHEMIDRGILTTMDKVELIEGRLVDQMAKNPPHESAIRRLNSRLLALLPAGWVLSPQGPVTFTTSEPEPDFTIARGTEADFDTRHPEPAEVGLLVEVSDSSLAFDRTDKSRVYGRGGVAVYWVVNVVDRRIEVYTDPTGPAAQPGYRTRTDYPPGMDVPVVLGGSVVGTVAVGEVIV
jgi:Putative restriction endonuclease